VWVDAWAGAAGPVPAEREAGGCRVVLAPYGSGFLLQGLHPPAVSAGPGVVPKATPAASISPERWSLQVEGPDVPGESVRLEDLTSLPDWRDVEALRFSSSPGVYRAEASLPALSDGQSVRLHVGWVHGAATVRVNGQAAGTLLAPPFALDVSGLVSPGPNALEITVIPALRNRLQGYAAQGDERYRQFAGSEDMLLPGGIRGPVTLSVMR
jgi:hypothetical protein